MLKTNKEEEGSIDISFAGLFRCMLCTHPKSKAEQVQLLQISEQILEIDSKLKQLELYEYFLYKTLHKKKNLFYFQKTVR